MPFGIRPEGTLQFRFGLNCRDAVAAKRKRECPDRKGLSGDCVFSHMSVLGVAGVYPMVPTTVSGVVRWFEMFIISEKKVADDFRLVIRIRVDFFLLGPIAQRELLENFS